MTQSTDTEAHPVMCGAILGPHGVLVPKLPPPPPAPRRSAAPLVIQGLLHAVTIFVLGALTVLLARLVRIVLMTPVEALTGWDLVVGEYHFGPLVDFGLAYFLGKAVQPLFGGSLSYAGRWRMLGVWAAITLMHNLVWWFPDAMRTIYSEAWVDEIEMVSEPDSIHLVVTSIPFADIRFGPAEPGSRERPAPFSLQDGEDGRASPFVSSGDRRRKTSGFKRQTDMRRDY